MQNFVSISLILGISSTWSLSSLSCRAVNFDVLFMLHVEAAMQSNLPGSKGTS
jgi:hypothetical protein